MSQDVPDDLIALRREIDEVNRGMLTLLARRGALVRRVAELARSGQAPPGQDGAREAEMVAGLLAANPGPYTNEEVARIFKSVLEASLALKQRMMK